MWRRLVLGVVLCLLVGVGAGIADELPPGGTFVDDNGNVHEAFIEAIAAEEITRGCNPPVNNRYCPSATVTRGQMAAFLVRALNLTDDGGGNTFTDDDGSTFESDIAKLAAAGITKGCNPPDNTRFCPDNAVTRGQMAAFLVRALSLTDDGGGNTFTDDDGSTFELDIAKLAAAGITQGCNPPTNDRFCPDEPVRRDQMASFLGRALNLQPITPITDLELLCGPGLGDVSQLDIEADLTGDGIDEEVRFAPAGADWTELRVSSGEESLVHRFPASGFGYGAEAFVGDLTGDGLDDLAICVSHQLNDRFTRAAVVSHDGGSLRLVLDIADGMSVGGLRGAPGTVDHTETYVWWAGNCVYTVATRYDWQDTHFRPVDNRVTVEVDNHPDCAASAATQDKNHPPTAGFVMGFTELGGVEGETLLVSGPDDQSNAFFCAGPGSWCDVRSFDLDGEIWQIWWFLNGKLVSDESPTSIKIDNFRTGYNTVTLRVRDNTGAVVFVSGYVIRDRK